MGQWENKGGSDHYYTPKYIFDALECEFDMDVAAPVDRTFCDVPAKAFITERSLETDWIGFVWMNPPFSGRNGKNFWLEKIKAHGSGIGFLPDRTSAPWWQQHAPLATEVLFLKEKVKMIRPDGTIAKQPGNGTCLFAYGELGVKAILTAQKNKLGITL